MNVEDVLYPPVNEADHIRPASENDFPKEVVSMGRFSADKRQLEQIEIAARLPDWSFTLIGFGTNPTTCLMQGAHPFAGGEKCTASQQRIQWSSATRPCALR